MIQRMNRRTRLFKSVLYLVTCCFSMTFGFGGVAAQQDASVPEPEKKQLVEQGVAQYKAGDRGVAKKTLEQAKSAFPDNYAVPFYLGLIYLEEGQKDAAINEWQTYMRLDPASQNSLRIRKNLTLLQRGRATEQAGRLLSAEKKAKQSKTQENLFAVSIIENRSYENLGPMGKGIAFMLSRDLSKLPDLKIVDWVLMQAMLREIGFPGNTQLDQKSAGRLGKLLNVSYISSGEMVEIDNGQVVFKTALLDGAGQEKPVTRQTLGDLENFYNLQKEIACGIAKDLGKDCGAGSSDFSKIHTKNLQAMLSFSWGLDFMDDEEYDEARVMFQQALGHDPSFELAQEALMATPYSGMRSWTIAQMAAETAAYGFSSEVAGTAVVGSVVQAEQAAPIQEAPRAATSGGGLSRGAKIGIAGGAILGLAALAGGGGGGGGGSGPDTGGAGGPTTPPAQLADLRGGWSGGWDGAQPGKANLTISQTDANINGTAAVTEGTCITDGNITGSISGNKVLFYIASGTSSATIDATYTQPSMQGTITFTGGPCVNSPPANFSATIETGGADVRW